MEKHLPTPPPPSRHRGVLQLLGAFALGGLLFSVAPALAREADATWRKLRIFTQVLSYVQQSYVEEVPEEQLVHGAVRGMLETLDPHTAFMPPEEFKKLKEDTAGEFGGLGLEIEEKDGAIVVVAPIEGAPAARAGMEAGDKLLAVDGQALTGTRLHDAWKMLRGMAGTKVVLRVMRQGWVEPKDVALIRERVKLVSVEGKLLEPGLAHVRIKGFNERVGRDLQVALEQAQAQSAAKGAPELRGLILDLRNNPGGLLEEAVRVADLFLAEGDIVTTEGRGRKQLNRQRAHPKDTQPNYPIIVLVNEGTASASEIVAGALQDHGRALIMGTQTFGKGSVQTIMELEDGSGLKLTVARYFTPRGRSIQERGITPDVHVEAGTLPEGDGDKPAQTNGAPLRERDLQRHLRNTTEPTPATAPALKDAQLRTAWEYLRAWQIFARTSNGGTDMSRR
ncbi:MAG: S41 family peptidase [Myxococcota bacterium]